MDSVVAVLSVVGAIFSVVVAVAALLLRARSSRRTISSRVAQSIEYRSAPPDTLFSFGRPGQEEEARQRSALGTAAGKLVYQIPPRMRLRDASTAEVRIGTEAMRGLMSNFASDTPLEEENIRIVQKMAVRLHGEPGAFHIVEQSEPMQLIGPAPIAGGEFQAQQFGRWLFEVTPKKLGRRTIYVTVSGEVTGEGGIALRALPPRTFEVHVQIGANRLFTGAALQIWALIGLLFASIIGAATQDIWWPQIRATLQGMHVVELQEPTRTPAD